MTGSYDLFLGKTYQTLLTDASFLSLIGGNVPEVIDEGVDRFYIISNARNAEFVFCRQDETLMLILFKASSDGSFPNGLSTAMSAKGVHEILGIPVEVHEKKKMPVFGTVPSWERFSNGLRVTYSLDSGTVEDIRYSMKQ
ncbi:hypothetical protein LRP50_13760 [Enterovibrio sp. ZSDZ42]|uniref:Pyocin immunity protein n=1 Tax=Enterovibrio gelatinilyticus TaxID=2899819 RepID=A0ABT5R3W7_9GAMM|nr:hypothetical protein [Enterovibrio sp. ZSDZ42]MDD1794202.1 hypothetical protein [Enterovibrio sp. ZSDZ42]